MAMAGTAVRRSTTFKQFLLRVHPDHFRAIPKVHDENLQSIQLLNQYMDEQRALASSYYSGDPRKRVFFSAYVPAAAPAGDDEQRTLRRFRLDLASNIEDNMERILRECGVEIPRTEPESEACGPSSSSSSSLASRDRSTWDFDSDQYRSSTSDSSTTGGGMDYGFNEHFAQYMHTRRSKRSIRTIHEFFTYMGELEIQQKQQQIRHAWESIQSVKRTLVREFSLHEVVTSCGWASVPLNATLMSLLKTLRKLSVSDGRHAAFLRGVRLDMRADASEIDLFNEYTVVLNVADVPLQWVEVLEKVDDEMLRYIDAAHTSLQQLQHAAEQAIGGGVSILRGRTCSAIAYRGFLQDMASTAPAFADDPMRVDSHRSHIIEKVTVVVEDSVRDCEILDDGRVRAPSCTSAAHVLDFLDLHRPEIRDQVAEFEVQRDEFELVSKQCIASLGLASLTYAEGLKLLQVNRACSKLLAFATTDNGTTAAPATTELLAASRGRDLRFDRFFGLAQDGVFTLSLDL